MRPSHQFEVPVAQPVALIAGNSIMSDKVVVPRGDQLAHAIAGDGQSQSASGQSRVTGASRLCVDGV
jgi:hypothetical protein